MGLIATTIYWFARGRKIDHAKARTARILFWTSFIASVLSLNGNKVTP